MSYVENFHHIIFRTRGSRKTIPEAEKRTMLAYMYKVSQEMGVTVLRLNAYLNHVHIFANLPSDMAVSEYVQKVKATSSKAFHGHAQFPDFDGWARRFGSFSKSKEDKDKIVNYIRGQEEHHRHKTFREELEELFGTEFFRDSYNRRDWLDEEMRMDRADGFVRRGARWRPAHRKSPHSASLHVGLQKEQRVPRLDGNALAAQGWRRRKIERGSATFQSKPTNRRKTNTGL